MENQLYAIGRCPYCTLGFEHFEENHIEKCKVRSKKIKE